MKKTYDPLDTENIITFDEVQEREIKWLWYPYIPMEMTTMLYGRGGIGKSHIVADIAARISTGAPFPGTEERRKPGNVLILSAEDDYGASLKPRLRRAGADMSRIHAPRTESFVLTPKGIDKMQDLMTRYEVAFVYIDPVMVFLGGKINMNQGNEVREWTGALNSAARQSGVAIVIVHHETKSNDTAMHNRALGSVDFVNAMRSTLYVERTNDGTRIMRNTKNNNAKEGEAITFTLGDDGFQWGEFISDGGIYVGGRQTNTAKDFMRTYLADGPVPAVTFIAAALDAGITKGTLDRAKNGVAESYAKRVEGRTMWFWRLKGDKREPAYVQNVGNGGRNQVPGLEGENPHGQPDRDPADSPRISNHGEDDQVGRNGRKGRPVSGGDRPGTPRDIPGTIRRQGGFTKDNDPKDAPQPGWYATLDPETIANLKRLNVKVPE